MNKQHVFESLKCILSNHEYEMVRNMSQQMSYMNAHLVWGPTSSRYDFNDNNTYDQLLNMI